MPELNVTPGTLMQGDNLAFLRAINSETVDLVATDPPFNKGRDFHATPDSLAAGASFASRTMSNVCNRSRLTDAEYIRMVERVGVGAYPADVGADLRAQRLGANHVQAPTALRTERCASHCNV